MKLDYCHPGFGSLTTSKVGGRGRQLLATGHFPDPARLGKVGQSTGIRGQEGVALPTSGLRKETSFGAEGAKTEEFDQKKKTAPLDVRQGAGKGLDPSPHQDAVVGARWSTPPPTPHHKVSRGKADGLRKLLAAPLGKGSSGLCGTLGWTTFTHRKLSLQRGFGKHNPLIPNAKMLKKHRHDGPASS